MVIASIQPATFSPFTVRLWGLTFSTLPWKTYSFLPAGACAKQTNVNKPASPTTTANRCIRFIVILSNISIENSVPQRSHFQRHQTCRYPAEKLFPWLRFADRFSPCAITSQSAPTAHQQPGSDWEEAVFEQDKPHFQKDFPINRAGTAA